MKKFYIGAVGLALSGLGAVFFLTGTAPEGWTDRGMAWGFIAAVVGAAMSIVCIAASLETENFDDVPDPWQAPASQPVLVPPPAPPPAPQKKPAPILRRKAGSRRFKFQETHP